MKLMSRLLYEPRHVREEPLNDTAFTRSVVISAVGILVCMICLFGLSWAWFSSTVATDTHQITAATFDLAVTVTEQGTGTPAEKGEDGYYSLDPAKTYAVSLLKSGTAQVGFCHLSVITPGTETATVYYTDPIPARDAVTEEVRDPYIFTVSRVSAVKFRPMWGQHPEVGADRLVPYGSTLAPGLAALTAAGTTAPDETATTTAEPTTTTTAAVPTTTTTTAAKATAATTTTTATATTTTTTAATTATATTTTTAATEPFAEPETTTDSAPTTETATETATEPETTTETATEPETTAEPAPTVPSEPDGT